MESVDDGIVQGVENPHAEAVSALTGNLNRDIGVSGVALIGNQTIYEGRFQMPFPTNQNNRLIGSGIVVIFQEIIPFLIIGFIK